MSRALRLICIVIVIASTILSCNDNKHLGLTPNSEDSRDTINLSQSVFDISPQCLNAWLDENNVENIRQWGYGISDDSIHSIQMAKEHAYYLLLAEWLSHVYPMLFQFYDESIMDDYNVVCSQTIVKNDNIYRSDIVLEIPITIMDDAVGLAIEYANMLDVTTVRNDDDTEKRYCCGPYYDNINERIKIFKENDYKYDKETSELITRYRDNHRNNDICLRFNASTYVTGNFQPYNPVYNKSVNEEIVEDEVDTTGLKEYTITMLERFKLQLDSINN
ncbi:MAG: hypothetical protein J6W12_05270 [Bacteroidales bacterium]|nr:hypothetical protein [Bacteroidales bacterium]